jgi:SAM-dependent methyltransferase
MMYFPDRVDLSDTSALGQHFCHYNVERPAVKAVRNRRKVLTRMVDEVAATVDRPKVLSVACGHLREIELSQAAANGQLQEYVGFDQDVDSLAEVNKRYQHLGVKTCHGSVRDFLTSKAQFEDFDLVYAAGLFDYLNEKTAKRLVACLFNILRSGGRLLIANFLPRLPDTGYMESYAGWKLIYRSEPEMQALLSEIPNRTAQNARLFTEEEGKILFLQVEKR